MTNQVNHTLCRTKWLSETMSFVNQLAICQVGCPLGALACANPISPKIATLVYLRPGVTTWRKRTRKKQKHGGRTRQKSKQSPAGGTCSWFACGESRGPTKPALGEGQLVGSPGCWGLDLLFVCSTRSCFPFWAKSRVICGYTLVFLYVSLCVEQLGDRKRHAYVSLLWLSGCRWSWQGTMFLLIGACHEI